MAGGPLLHSTEVTSLRIFGWRILRFSKVAGFDLPHVTRSSVQQRTPSQANLQRNRTKSTKIVPLGAPYFSSFLFNHLEKYLWCGLELQSRGADSVGEKRVSRELGELPRL